MRTERGAGRRIGDGADGEKTAVTDESATVPDEGLITALSLSHTTHLLLCVCVCVYKVPDCRKTSQHSD